MIKNIVFDIGNVLVKFRWYDLMVDLGFDQSLINQLRENMIEHPLWVEFDKGIMKREEIIEGFKVLNPNCTKQVDLFLKHMEEIVEPFEYVEEWMKTLKDKGYHLYYLSNYGKDYFEVHKDKHFKFLPYMEGGVVSANVHLIKPDPSIYKYLLDTYKLKPEETLFIDDRKENIEGARKCHIKGIIFESYEKTKQILETYIEEGKKEQ